MWILKYFLPLLFIGGLSATAPTNFVPASGCTSSGSPCNWSSSATWTPSAVVVSLNITAGGVCSGSSGTDGLWTNNNVTAGNARSTFSYTISGSTMTAAVITWHGYGYVAGTPPTTFSLTTGSCVGTTITATVTAASLDTVPGDGDSINGCPASESYITINQDIGTTGNGIQQTGLCKWTLSITTGGRYGIYFASTGSVPTGNGPDRTETG